MATGETEVPARARGLNGATGGPGGRRGDGGRGGAGRGPVGPAGAAGCCTARAGLVATGASPTDSILAAPPVGQAATPACSAPAGPAERVATIQAAGRAHSRLLGVAVTAAAAACCTGRAATAAPRLGQEEPPRGRVEPAATPGCSAPAAPAAARATSASAAKAASVDG